MESYNDIKNIIDQKIQHICKSYHDKNHEEILRNLSRLTSDYRLKSLLDKNTDYVLLINKLTKILHSDENISKKQSKLTDISDFIAANQSDREQLRKNLFCD